MIYKFTIISEEVDGFLRDIQIDSEASFLDLHKAIFDSVSYENVPNAAFYICDDYWDKENEVLLQEIDNNPEYDTWLMEETTLDYFLEEEHQRLMHVFNLENERCFYIELTEIIPGSSLDEAKCTRSIEEAPSQFPEDENVIIQGSTVDVDEDFYGSQDFDIEDLAAFDSKDESDL